MITRPTPRRLTARTRGGFTLLEVLVVVAILVILASVATFATMSYLERARRSQAKLQMQKIVQAAESYYTQYSQIPTTQMLIMPTEDGQQPLLPGGPAAITDPWNQPFQLTETVDQYGSQRFMVISSGNGQPIQWPEK
jgi:prepilin-type N-terminal cleavage/methylation domain-containing protein